MSWCKVTWQVSYVDADNFRSPYDLDLGPDLSPAVGQVTLHPVQRAITTASQTFMPRPVVCSFDDEGFLLGPDGTRGVYVLPTPLRPTVTGVPVDVLNPDTFTADWVWTCKPVIDGVRYVKPFSFVALENTVVDLSAWVGPSNVRPVSLAEPSVDSFVLDRLNALEAPPVIVGASVVPPDNRLSFVLSNGNVVDAGALVLPSTPVATASSVGVVSVGAGLVVNADGVLSSAVVEGPKGDKGDPGQGIATVTYTDATVNTVRPEAPGLVYWFYSGATTPPPRPTNAINYDLVLTTGV